MDTLLAERTWLERLARRLADDRAGADDLVQEALVAGWRSPPDAGAPVRGWLAAVTRNAHRNRRRDDAARRRWHEAAAADGEAHAPAADELLARHEAEATVRRLVAMLPPVYREAVQATYFDERSSIEVQAESGVPAGTTRWRVKVALERLRAGLDRHYGDRECWRAALLGLPAGVPTAAGAAGLGGAKGLAVGKGALGVPFLAFLLPTLVALVGIFLPLRHVMKRALDGRERRELALLGAISAASVVQFTWVMAWSVPRGARQVQLASFLLLEVAMIALYGFWLPRIISRRHVAERTQDPEGAPRRQARERLWGRIGLTLGTGIGALGFLQGFLRSP